MRSARALILLTIVCLCGCSQSNNAPTDLRLPPTGLGMPAFPASDMPIVRRTSLDSLICRGLDYWQKSPGASDGLDVLSLTPPYGSYEYGIYQFPITAGDEIDSFIYYVSDRSTLIAKVWLMLANYRQGRWELVSTEASDTLMRPLPGPLSDYTSPGGYLYVALLADGTESYNIRCLELRKSNLPDEPSAWGSFGYDRQCTRRTSAAVVDSANVLWKSFQEPHFITSAPTLGSDGAIYVASWTSDNKGVLYALNADGSLRWTYALLQEVQSSPAVGPDGAIYFGCDYNGLHCLNRIGELRWRYPTGREIYSSPTIGSDGTIYFGCLDKKVYAVHPDGTTAWTFIAEAGLYGTPAIAADSTICIADALGNLYALHPDGSQYWQYPGDGSVYGAPAIGADGTIYYATSDGNFYAVHPNGELFNMQAAGGEFRTSPALSADGSVYIGNTDGKLYIYHADGTPDTTFDAGASIRTSAAIDGNGRIFFANNDGHVFALNPDLSVQWEYEAGEQLRDSPTIAGGGELYFAGFDGTLFAFGPNAPQPPAVPTGLAASQGAFSDMIRLTWDEQYDANGFEIYKDGDTVNPVAILGYEFTWDDLGIPDNSPHTYQLKAINEYGASDLCAPATGNATGENPGAGQWNMMGQDAAHSGNCSLSGPHTKHLAWSYPADTASFSSPVIGAQGEIYFTTEGDAHGVTSVDASGAFRWAYPTSNYPARAAAIDEDGYIYCAEQDRMFRLKPDGSGDWSVPYAGYTFGAPTLYDGKVFICGENSSAGNYTYALRMSDGFEEWKYPQANRLCEPAIGSDGTVFTAAQGSNRIYAIDPTGGSALELGGNQSVDSPPVVRLDPINGDVVIFISGDDVYAKKLDDSIVFSFVSDSIGISGCAILPDASGYYMAGTKARKVDNAGGELWAVSIFGNGANQLPAVDAEGYLYVATSTGYLRCIAPDGALAWEYDCGTDLRYSSPALGPNARVYICGQNGTLYAFDEGA